MDTFFRHLIHLAYHAGAWGLLCVGVLDSSILFLPLGNDLLLMGLSARHPGNVVWYVLAATAGSIAGSALTLWIAGKGGEKIGKPDAKKRSGVSEGIRKHIGWALAVASVMPPPFPFTPFLAAAGAMKIGWKKALSIVAGGRFARFVVEAALAVHYGRWIMTLAKSPTLRNFVIVMMAVAAVGSGVSIYRLTKRTRKGSGRRLRAQTAAES